MKKKAKPKKVKTSATKSKPKSRVVNIKMEAKEFKRLKERSNDITKGNLSAWLRAAGLRYTPTVRERKDILDETVKLARRMK